MSKAWQIYYSAIFGAIGGLLAWFVVGALPTGAWNIHLANLFVGAEVGLFIGDKSCWNKGYGTEVMRLLLRHGFGTLNLNRIFLRVDAANQGGIRAYEKAGFVHEGRFREGTFRDGHYEDMLFMSVLRSEWQADDNKWKGKPHGK